MNHNRILKSLSKKMSGILLTLGLIFSFSIHSISIPSNFDIFCSYALLTCALGHTWASFQKCPSLYKQEYTSPEEYLSIVESRVTAWSPLLESFNEEQLSSFREELLDYYENILKNRSLASFIFEPGAPYEPWALFDKEIKQHLTQLESYSTEIYPEELVKKANNLKITLTKIKKRTQSLPSYQNECSHARQESQIAEISHTFHAFFCFYSVNQLLKGNPYE